MWHYPARRTCLLICGGLFESCARRVSFHSSTSRHAPLASLHPNKRRQSVTAPPITPSPLLSQLDDEPLGPRHEQLRQAKQQADDRRQSQRTKHTQHRLEKQQQWHQPQHSPSQHTAPKPAQRHLPFTPNSTHRAPRKQQSRRGLPVDPLFHLVTPRRSSFIPAATMPPLLASALRPITRTTKPRLLSQVTTDPYWTNIPSLESLHMDRLGTFTPPSRDHTLIQLAASAGLPIASSTSSTTPPLSHCAYAVMGREGGVDVSLLGEEFAGMRRSFTFTATSPVSVILRRRWVDVEGRVVAKHISREAMEAGAVVVDGVNELTSVWAVDRLQGPMERTTILSELGQAMERMLTMEPAEFQAAFVKQAADATTPAATSSDTFTPPVQQYSYLSTGTSLIRAQLDCHDPALTTPPSPVFDIKTRATHAIRYNLNQYKKQLDYHITRLTGLYNSYEREYYDMGRSAFLKYALQCRIGGMQGVMVAYHNTEQVFGMQMISVREMERLILGRNSQLLGEHVYTASSQLLDTVYRRVTERVRAEAKRTRRVGVGGLEEAVKVTLARNVFEEERTMTVYVELSGPPADDFDASTPFSHRHHTLWRLDVLDLADLQAIAAEHGMTAFAASTDRAELLVALENQLSRTSSRQPPSVEHIMHLITTGRLLRYRIKVQHTVDGMLVERWNELTADGLNRLQSSYEIREQRVDGEAFVRRMATEYRLALLEGRLHVEEEEGGWDVEDSVEEEVEVLEAKAVVDGDVGVLEQKLDQVAHTLVQSNSHST